MNEDIKANSVLKDIEDHNPAVAHVFRTFRARSRHVDSSEAVTTQSHGMPDEVYKFHYLEASYDSAALNRRRSLWGIFVALALLAVGFVAFGIVIGPTVVHFILRNWMQIVLPAGGLCLGAGVVLLVSRVGASSPLRKVAPPDENSEDPLHELRDLAQRTASRLRGAYRLQLWIVLAVGTVFIALIVWSMVMVSQERILYASAFGSGGVAMVILTQWKWQPFDRINEARRLADTADTLATGLRLRIKTISEIQDPSERAKEQWNAVSEYLDRS